MPYSQPSEANEKRHERFRKLSSWYARWERPISSLSLIGGFLFDALTLTRVDLLWENFWVIAHISIVGLCIIILNAIDRNVPANAEVVDGIIMNGDGNGMPVSRPMLAPEENPERLHFWLVNIMQFFFGGIWSTFLVYYFRSGSLVADWPFLTLLAAAFIANERFKRHYTRLIIQIALFYLSLLAFMIFIIPVLVHSIGLSIFLLSGLASLVLIGIFLVILRFAAKRIFTKKRIWQIRGVILGIFAIITTLYFFNFIPPLPLSLKDSGVYHSLEINAPGNYTVTYENPGSWFASVLAYFRLDDTIHLTPDSQLYAYTAVFSPEQFNLTIIHEWQYHNPATKQWITRAKIPLMVTGGSDGGYRTFSLINAPTPGAWRVKVETQNGAVIGELDFTIVAVSSTPPLETEQIN